ncbi:hypothetical protein MCW82_07020 [Azospirillum doebereinerae]|uniref:DUF4376 domain-containing protein n=1 Tax=Azospirillum doebereinerae TaxID=92933 RepID=UPI001EE54542|nr:hypothetical protein [Azospirillum doebereinerae]MCG5239518.1 hypothetical protein [Azospirillum doebereinerae]
MAIVFPVAACADGVLLRIYRGPEDFVGPDGVWHFAAVWSCWSAADWEVACPGWSLLPLIEEPPADTAILRYSRRPKAAWSIGADAVTVTYAPTEIPLAERRAAVVADVKKLSDWRLQMGAPVANKRIDVSDKGRADLAGMALAALLAQAGAAPWSEGYSEGWITQNNSRMPLPEPTDGLALAAAVGDWYGRTVQHARSLKDEALASDTPEGIDLGAGWP